MPLPCPINVLSVASCFPDTEFTQQDVKEILGIENPVVGRLLDAPHIATRRLMFDPSVLGKGKMPAETPAQLNSRFQAGLLQLGKGAATKALKHAAVEVSAIDYIVCVTSTGLPLPGLSAILIRELGLKRSVHRLDVVGMGCNAGMTALKSLAMLLSAQPRATGLLVCVEICSALYVSDNTVGTGIVNSLFGDGAAAAVLTNPPAISTSTNNSFASAAGLHSVTARPSLALVDFESCTLTDYFDDMMYEVKEEHQAISFKLTKRIPFAVGDNVHVPVLDLLRRNGLEVADVAEWVVHSGGAAVMEGIRRNLQLPRSALRHTESVLLDYGNISSGSFLASYERLVDEHLANAAANEAAVDGITDRKVLKEGDRIVLIAMGPGTTIEVGLARVSVNRGPNPPSFG